MQCDAKFDFITRKVSMWTHLVLRVISYRVMKIRRYRTMVVAVLLLIETAFMSVFLSV